MTESFYSSFETLDQGLKLKNVQLPGGLTQSKAGFSFWFRPTYQNTTIFSFPVASMSGSAEICQFTSNTEQNCKIKYFDQYSRLQLDNAPTIFTFGNETKYVISLFIIYFIVILSFI